MLTRWHIPKGWPSEQQEILRRLQQSPTSQPEETVRTVVEFLYPETLIRPTDQEFLARSRRFRAVKNTRFIQIECLHATVHRKKEFRTSRPNEERRYFCIVCRTSGKTIWRIPDEPDDTQFECITMTWYELP